jgi:hypothetical protein
MFRGDRSAGWMGFRAGVLALAAAAMMVILPAAASAASAGGNGMSSRGEVDCNGDSNIQQALRVPMNCTDIRGINGEDNPNTWGGRFYDNGKYIGHDEPDMTFLSDRPGSGNDITWTELLPHDPSAAPTVSKPGADVAHWFELSVAPWFSMDMCDPRSYPQTPCSPESDANAPTTLSSADGGGSAFMEMQFYPPGFAPFDDSVSCDNSHWCAALTIDSLECTQGFATCNPSCEEPVNFAFIQNNGVPTGPASPQETDLASFTPNSHTLMMNPGDVVQVHMFDAPVPGGGGAKAFEVVVKDFTTHQVGYMQASAANGFQNTSMTDCSGTPFNFQPEYNTAARKNINPWGALATDVSTQFETGHFEPCTSLTDPSTNVIAPGVTDTYSNFCHGPYEATAPPDGGSSPELSDAFCYPAGDTHGSLNTAPDEITGCLDDVTQNGDLDFDGTPYWPEWPLGPFPTRTFPGSFVQALPTTGGGRQYQKFFIQTDLALSEASCDATTTQGCAVPAPTSPGKFYPYWSRASSRLGCFLEFGNVSSWGVNDYGKDSQYGTDQSATLGYPEFEGPVMDNRCNGRGDSAAIPGGI